MKKMRTYAEINLNNIRDNAQAVREIVGEKVKIMAVIKADGYGHGAIKCAKAVDSIVDTFAVATIEEAVELRNCGIEKEILILGYIFPENYEEAIENDVSLTVFSYDMANELSSVAEKCNKTASVHIALDTGMGRIGFMPTSENVSEVQRIDGLTGIKIDGMFSHFATSDEKDKRYSEKQISLFNQFSLKLKNVGVNIPCLHICNSAGITELEDCLFDMVRMGIILYGLHPSNEVDKSRINLKPALSFKSSVVNVKTISKGDSVSYGRHFVAEKDTSVATVSVGYADGYPRLLSNKGRVIINGKYAPVIGNVCMDQIMVNVSGIENVEIGTEVVLIGSQGGISVTADEIASLTHTINYEVVCGISNRVPRIYVG